MIKALIPFMIVALAYYFQWQANRLRASRYNVANSYALGKMYKQVNRYENYSRIIYIASVLITCILFLL